MSSSFSITESRTFTVTHARHIAAKVATDLKRMQRMYDLPHDSAIEAYEEEITELLKNGYLDTVTYGFKRDGAWIEPTLKYTAQELGDAPNDDDPGKIRPGANVADATFYSYLTYSEKWLHMTSQEREHFKLSLPIQRSDASEPQVAGGYFASDKTYSSGGRSLSRASVRSY